MSKVQAFWVHGSAVHAERDGYFITKRLYASGAVFKTHGKEWFQFPIPTPVIVDTQRSSLTQCFVLYATGSGARISDVEVFDGEKKIAGFNGLSLTGDHASGLDQSNAWLIGPPVKVLFGVAIRVRVDFGNPQAGSVPNVRFAAAGIDLTTP